MKKISILLMAVLLQNALVSFTIFNPRQPKNSHTKILILLEKEIELYREAFRRKDAKAMANLYAVDAVVVEHNEAVRYGNKAIENMWEENKKTGSKWVDVEIKRENIQVQGNVAYETGWSDFTYETLKGEIKHLKGQFMTVWKKQSNGSWKVQMEAWL